MAIEFVSYNKESLRKYVESDEYLIAEKIAISQHRAISQCNNPRSRAEDVLMIMAWDGAILVGYLGILPDDLYMTNEQPLHLGWLSCLWVNPGYRGKGVAGKLLKSALEAYDNNIILTEFTQEAGKLYEKSGLFVRLKCIEGKRYYYRFCLSALLPKKNKVFNQLIPLLKFSDFLINKILDFRFNKRALPLETTFFLRLLNFEVNCPNSGSHFSFFKRTFRDFDWIFNHPWIIRKDEKFRYSERYYFSAVDPSFENLFYHSKAGVGEFIWLTYRNSHLKTAHINCKNDDQIKILMEDIFCSGRVDFFTTYDAQMINILKKLKLKPIFSKPIKRSYMVSHQLMKKIAESHIELKIDDGDGDCIFT